MTFFIVKQKIKNWESKNTKSTEKLKKKKTMILRNKKKEIDFQFEHFQIIITENQWTPI